MVGLFLVDFSYELQDNKTIKIMRYRYGFKNFETVVLTFPILI